MKKIISSIIAFLLAVLPMSAFAVVSVVYDVSGDAIVFSGAFGEDVEAVSVHIANPNEDNTVSAENPPIVSDLILTDDSGNISKTIKNTLPFGAYNVFFGYENSEAEFVRIVIFDPDSTAAKETLKRINSAKSANDAKAIASDSDAMISVGIDIGADSLAQDAMIIVVNIRPASGYSAETFADAYGYAKAVAAIENSKDADSVMKSSSAAFGCSYEEYISAKEDADIDGFILKGGCGEERMNLSEIAALAKVTSSLSRGDIEEAVTDNASSLGVDISSKSKFSDIPEKKRHLLWSALLEDANDVTTKSQFKTLFDKCVKSTLSSLDSDNSSGGSSSGGSSGGGYSSSIGPTTISPSVPSNTAKFSDVDSHFAYDNIMMLSEKGIISGYPDSTFRPNGNITRAELCKIIVTSFGFDTNSDASFDDVADDAWYYSFVASLASKGIVKGYDGKFNPNSFVTRQDTALMLKRALEYKGVTLEGSYNFADSASIDAYAKEAVEALASNGYLKGDGTNFNPKNNITRGEAAELLGRIYKVYGGE